MFEAHLTPGNLLRGCVSNKIIKKTENLHKKCFRNVCLSKYTYHTQPLFKCMFILNLKEADKIREADKKK